MNDHCIQWNSSSSMQGNPPLVEHIKEIKNIQGLFWIEKFKFSEINTTKWISLIWFSSKSVQINRRDNWNFFHEEDYTQQKSSLLTRKVDRSSLECLFKSQMHKGSFISNISMLLTCNWGQAPKSVSSVCKWYSSGKTWIMHSIR